MNFVRKVLWLNVSVLGVLGFRRSLPQQESVCIDLLEPCLLLTSEDTFIQEGKIPVRMDESGKVLESGKPRETREFNGKTYLMEEALTGDVAILRAWKADEAGNCVFR